MRTKEILKRQYFDILESITYITTTKDCIKINYTINTLFPLWREYDMVNEYDEIHNLLSEKRKELRESSKNKKNTNYILPQIKAIESNIEIASTKRDILKVLDTITILSDYWIDSGYRESFSELTTKASKKLNDVPFVEHKFTLQPSLN